MDLQQHNQHRAQLVIQTLLQQGVNYFCIAPGSRSTPLAQSIYSLAKERSCVHFDERGLGFHALGFAKAKKEPVAILVTSGTAVANLLPSVIEASLSRIPLILLTADRPHELRDCGANQTIDQINIFSSYTRWMIDLPLSDLAVTDRYIAASISYGTWAAKRSPPGPVHINCMIREPLFSLAKSKTTFLPSCLYDSVETVPTEETLLSWQKELLSIEKGIILLGSSAIEADPAPFVTLAEKLGWPIFADILSGGRKIGVHPLHVQHPDLFIRSYQPLAIKAVLHIGDRICSKTLATWLVKQTNLTYYQVSSSPLQQDPDHLVSRRIECSCSSMVKALSSSIATYKDSPWKTFWQTHCKKISVLLEEYFSAQEELSEPAIAYSLRAFSHFFFSNSMPVRDADLFLFPEKGISLATANRGASGIDGNLATASGIALALEKPLVALLGDMASLHDINSLALIARSPVPIICIVINNQGGGIFSFLPVAEDRPFCEEFVATAHTYSFADLAKSFSIPYFSVDSLEEWMTIQKQMQLTPKTCLIECKTKRDTNVLQHEALYTKLREHVANAK